MMNKPKIEWKKYKNQLIILLDDEILGESSIKKKAEVELSPIGYNLLKNYSFNEIPENFISFELTDDYDSLYIILNIPPFRLSHFYLYRNTPEESKLYISLFFDFLNWNLSLSPNQFTKLFMAEMKLNKRIDSEIDKDIGLEGVLFEISLRISIKNNLTIEENVNYLVSQIEKTTRKLLVEVNEKSLSIDTFFSFPEEYKTACEQYLLYFATFLKDLGIEAKTDLENQENGVLFKVFPKDKEEALSQIKEALAIYLALPVQQNIDEVATQFPDAAVQQLISNVYHLKSQLVLANSTILQLQRQNEALELFQYQDKPIIHLGEFDKNQKNEEKIFGGIVTVKEYEGTGFNIDLPKLFRMMKRIWNK